LCKYPNHLSIEAIAQIKPQLDPKASSCHSFGAVFAEVAVDPDICTVRM
jgi:CO/xanthine dehydrogenase Mo-binding subunit